VSEFHRYISFAWVRHDTCMVTDAACEQSEPNV
jgi:hypothetical protein